ncbi:MAG: DUF2235 domain-containing protein [Balneolales bacterium]
MKRLILCCDGTWNRADRVHDNVPPTNVVKMTYRIAARDGDIPQVVYYGHGVGTGNIIDRYTGGAFGHGLEDNILDAYRFLVVNYEEGDEIFLFGFSRGAFTARSLSGLIRNCGILKRASAGNYRKALNLYQKQGKGPDHPESVAFKKKHSVCGGKDIRIKFIGVWDTVGALGIPFVGFHRFTRRRYRFHDTKLSSLVEYAYQALAIDEHRAPFKPSLWQLKPKPDQTIEQVWFCGAHADVGGGYPSTSLSDITLDWMISKARIAGLVFDETAVQAFPFAPDPLGKLHNSKQGLYRLGRSVDRVICKAANSLHDPGDTAKLLHESVLVRWEKDPAYRPAPLRKFFARIRDARNRAAASMQSQENI